MTINEAIKAAMTEWRSQEYMGGGTPSIEAMREQIDQLIDEAIAEWTAEHGTNEDGE